MSAEREERRHHARASARNDTEVPITVGLDTHLDLLSAHVAVVVDLDHLGCRLDELTVPTTEAGYAKLLRWAEALGSLERVGTEGALGLSAPAWRYLQENATPTGRSARVSRRSA